MVEDGEGEMVVVVAREREMKGMRERSIIFRGGIDDD